MSNQLDYRRTNSRPVSPERYSAASNHTYDSTTTSASNKYPSSDAISDRRSSSESQSNVTETRAKLESAYRSQDDLAGMPRKSFASDSSLDELVMPDDCNGAHSKRRRSRRAKVHRQQWTTEDTDLNSVYYQTDEELSPHYSSGRNKHGLRLPVCGGYTNMASGSGSQLRHIVSEATLYIDSGQGPMRRQSDSQSSDFSDIRLTSPPAESLSPSSPDYRGSPRQSADSDMLDLRKY